MQKPTKSKNLLHSERPQLLETEVERKPVSDVALVVPVHIRVIVVHVVRGQPVGKLRLHADVGALAEVGSMAAYDGVVLGERHVAFYQVSTLPCCFSDEINSHHCQADYMHANFVIQNLC